MREPSLRRNAATCAVALAVLAASPAARADGPPRTSSLGWIRMPGAEACIATRALARAVERRLGREVFVSAAEADVSVEGRIERTGSPPRWQAVVTISGDDGQLLGTRELKSEAPSCSALDEELALVIAVMIDPEAALTPPPTPETPRPPPKPAPPPPTVVVRRELVPVVAPAQSPGEWRVGVEGGALFALGLLPGVGVGATLRARVEPRGLPAIELGGAIFIPREAADGSSGANMLLGDGFVGVCPLVTRAAGGELEGCLAFAVGALRAGGFGYQLTSTQEQLVLDPSLEGRFRRRIAGPVTAALGLGLTVPIVRDRFYYTTPAGEQREVFKMSAVAGVLDVGVGIELP